MTVQTSTYPIGDQDQKTGQTNLGTPEYYQTQRNNLSSGQPMVDPAANIPSANYSAPLPPQTQQTVAPQPPSTPAGPTTSTDIQAPDSGAIRRRLMGSIPGASDAAGLPYNQNFDTGVQNLYASTMNQLAGYNQQEGDINTGYEKSRDYSLQAYDTAQKQLMDRMAFQGILNSGITTDQRAMLGQTYAQKLDNLASTQASALSKLAQQRVAAQGQYATKLSGLESGYTNNVATWLQNQAAQEAARQQNQAQEDANAQLLAQLQQAMNPQPEATMDWGMFQGSLDPINKATFEQPGGFLDKFFQGRTQILDENGNPLSLAQMMQLLNPTAVVQ